MQSDGINGQNRAGGGNGGDIRDSFVTAPVNSGIVVINIIVFIICMAGGDGLYDAGALIGDRVVHAGEYYRLITSMFLHAGIQHIFGNMLILAYIGAVVERGVGHWRYFVLYFVSGICGNAASVAFEQAAGLSWYSVGASGAIFGVMGAMLCFIFHGRRNLRKGSTLAARAGFMVVYSLYAGFANTGTNNVAHVGGLLTGIIIAEIFSAFKHSINMEELI